MFISAPPAHVVTAGRSRGLVAGCVAAGPGTGWVQALAGGGYEPRLSQVRTRCCRSSHEVRGDPLAGLVPPPLQASTVGSGQANRRRAPSAGGQGSARSGGGFRGLPVASESCHRRDRCWRGSPAGRPASPPRSSPPGRGSPSTRCSAPPPTPARSPARHGSWDAPTHSRPRWRPAPRTGWPPGAVAYRPRIWPTATVSATSGSPSAPRTGARSPPQEVVAEWVHARRAGQSLAAIAGRYGAPVATVRRETRPHGPFKATGPRLPDGVVGMKGLAQRAGISHPVLLKWRRAGRLPRSRLRARQRPGAVARDDRRPLAGGVRSVGVPRLRGKVRQRRAAPCCRSSRLRFTKPASRKRAQ